MKVIVAHPGKQHSFETAIAVKENGMLLRYITTVYDQSNSIVMKLAKRLLRGNEVKRAQGRKNERLDGCVTQFCELEGLLLLLIIRLDKTKSRVIYNSFNQYVANRFGKKVAQYAIRNNADAVICYDAVAMECFRILEEKAPHIIRILDNAAPNRYGLYEEYQRLDAESHIFSKQRSSFKTYLLNEKAAFQYKKEAQLADYHLVASSFSQRMLTNIGISEDRVFVIPYGFAAPQQSTLPTKETHEKLNFYE